jgi:methyl-accepting chemotaxis protein
MQDSQVAVLLENIEGQIQTLAESVTATRESLESKINALADTIDNIDNRLTRVEVTTEQIMEIVDEVYPVQATLTDHADTLGDHEARLHDLEMPQRA